MPAWAILGLFDFVSCGQGVLCACVDWSYGWARRWSDAQCFLRWISVWRVRVGFDVRLCCTRYVRVVGKADSRRPGCYGSSSRWE
jgi:hypothetical protein